MDKEGNAICLDTMPSSSIDHLELNGDFVCDLFRILEIKYERYLFVFLSNTFQSRSSIFFWCEF